MITLLGQRLRDTGSVADRKRSGRAFIMKTKVADVETTLQRSPLKRPSVYQTIPHLVDILDSPSWNRNRTLSVARPSLNQVGNQVYSSCQRPNTRTYFEYNGTKELFRIYGTSYYD
ncbi:hypothetical protein TNCV_1821181 [Trichonephila clavipes]|nr:hypothetical protein TNCV_1821181 [Trichonephila clavipes]